MICSISIDDRYSQTGQSFCQKDPKNYLSYNYIYNIKNQKNCPLSPGFLNKCIGILKNHSESLSFFQSLFFLGGLEKKRGNQNDSLELYSKRPRSSFVHQICFEKTLKTYLFRNKLYVKIYILSQKISRYT